MALLAAEEIVVLEAEVVNPEALLDVAVVLEERGVVELELLAVEEDTMLEVESVDVDAALDDVTVLEE